MLDARDWITRNLLRIVETVLLIAAVLMIIIGLSRMNSRIESLEASPLTPIIPVEKACLDYTLREYRAGEAPEKCGAEVYGDQFNSGEI